MSNLCREALRNGLALARKNGTEKLVDTLDLALEDYDYYIVPLIHAARRAVKDPSAENMAELASHCGGALL